MSAPRSVRTRFKIGPRSHGVPQTKCLRFQAYGTNRDDLTTIRWEIPYCEDSAEGGGPHVREPPRVRHRAGRGTGATGAGSIAIDLQQADQDSYQGLRAGDRVFVDGVVTDDRSRVIVDNIWRAGGGGGCDVQHP